MDWLCRRIFIKFKSSQNTETDFVCSLIRTHIPVVPACNPLLFAAFCAHLSHLWWIRVKQQSFAKNDSTFVSDTVRCVCVCVFSFRTNDTYAWYHLNRINGCISCEPHTCSYSAATSSTKKHNLDFVLQSLSGILYTLAQRCNRSPVCIILGL